MQHPKYVILPIDISTVKRAVFMGLTKHQLLGVLFAAACGIIPFFLIKAFFGMIGGAFAFFIVAAPIAFVFLYEKNGINFKKHISMVMDFRKKPRKRIYQSRNLAELAELEKEKIRLERSLKNGYVYKEAEQTRPT